MKVWIYIKDEKMMGVYQHRRPALQAASLEVYQLVKHEPGSTWEKSKEGNNTVWELIQPGGGGDDEDEIFCAIRVEKIEVNCEK